MNLAYDFRRLVFHEHWTALARICLQTDMAGADDREPGHQQAKWPGIRPDSGGNRVRSIAHHVSSATLV